MNKWITSLAMTLLAGSMAYSTPAFAAGSNVYGVRRVMDATHATPTNPGAVNATDPESFGSAYSVGYNIKASTSPTEFAGFDWPTSQLVGGKQPKLDSTDAGAEPPVFVSCNFVVPTGSLKASGTSYPNPNLTFVVQDDKGDYYYAGKNQGVTPTLVDSQGTHDLFLLQANNDGTFAQSGGKFDLHVLTRMALVWSGWNTLGTTAPPNITTIYVTNPIINSPDKHNHPAVNHSPAGYATTSSTPASPDSKFNFE